MKAFISYSHNDSQMLEVLHKHMAQLKRDGFISTWTDQEIMPGGNLNTNISVALGNAKIFIALLSPDYISSKYCYEKEFEEAINMEKSGKIVIVPVILEPCDWLSTPFKNFKALPNDGKAISTWDNKNTAFLDVIQNIRKLIDGRNQIPSRISSSEPITIRPTRNYRVKTDFDSIQKLEFADKTFSEVKDLIKRFLDEIVSIEGIKHIITSDNKITFESILVNRNKINSESKLVLSTVAEKSSFNMYSNEKQINYSIEINNRPSNKSFSLNFDEYHMYWSNTNFSSYNSNKNKEFGSKEIADFIWDEWLESVGIA